MGHRTRGKVKDRQDFSGLLQCLQNEDPSQAEGSSRPKPSGAGRAAVFLPSAERQRILSDQRIRFALVVKGAGFYIHDKSCPLLKPLPDDVITWLPDYDPGPRRCPQCELRSYLRLGAKDPARIHDYERLYEEFGFHLGILRRMYVEDGMRTELIGSDTLKVWGKEDTWLIKRIPGTQWGLELYHNNYRSKWDGTREFMPGYHLQASGNSRKYLLDMIAGYTYAGHKAAMRNKLSGPPSSQSASAPAAGVTPPPVPAEKRPGLWARLRAWLRRLFRR